MKRFLCFLPLCLLLASLSAQENPAYPLAGRLGTGEFFITGNVQHKPAKMNSLRLAVTDYLDNISYEIPVDAEGHFGMSIPVTDVQDVYLYLGDAITLFTFPGDTIRLSFSGENPKETLIATGTTPLRSKELELCTEIFRQSRRAYLDIYKLSYDRQKSADEKLEALNDYYIRQIALVNAFESENGPLPFLRKFQDEIYYHVARIAVSEKNLLSRLRCDYPRVTYTSIVQGSSGRDTTVHAVFPYEVLDYTAFRTIPLYRDFLSAFISLYETSFPWSIGYPEADSRKRESITSFAHRYDLGKEVFGKIPPIRDWYLARQMKMALTYEPLAAIDSLYHDFTAICQESAYLADLEPKYRRAVALSPGQSAPDFELKDLDGNTVRLSDFRGKIVYMDFWGNGCGPCIYEFQNSKEEFHRKYGGEDIVFIYVCVDSEEDEWRKGVEKYRLDGVNLVARGWTNNPVCQAYNVEGIPHYVLIDREGNIVNNKCDRPSTLLRMGAANELEQLLQCYKQE